MPWLLGLSMKWVHRFIGLLTVVCWQEPSIECGEEPVQADLRRQLWGPHLLGGSGRHSSTCQPSTQPLSEAFGIVIMNESMKIYYIYTAHIHSARGTQCIHNLSSHKLKLPKTFITMKCTTTVTEGHPDAVTEANTVVLLTRWACWCNAGWCCLLTRWGSWYNTGCVVCWPDGTADTTLVVLCVDQMQCRC